MYAIRSYYVFAGVKLSVAVPFPDTVFIVITSYSIHYTKLYDSFCSIFFHVSKSRVKRVELGWNSLMVVGLFILFHGHTFRHISQPNIWLVILLDTSLGISSFLLSIVWYEIHFLLSIIPGNIMADVGQLSIQLLQLPHKLLSNGLSYSKGIFNISSLINVNEPRFLFISRITSYNVCYTKLLRIYKRANIKYPLRIR